MRELLWLLSFPLMTQAAGEGTWQASGTGIILDRRDQSASSDPLVSSQPVSGLMTPVVWCYEPSGLMPAGLQVRLCSQSRCIELDGQSGTVSRLNSTPAIELMYSVWEAPGDGRLIPALRIQNNQMIADYY